MFSSCFLGTKPGIMFWTPPSVFQAALLPVCLVLVVLSALNTLGALRKSFFLWQHLVPCEVRLTKGFSQVGFYIPSKNCILKWCWDDVSMTCVAVGLNNAEHCDDSPI